MNFLIRCLNSIPNYLKFGARNLFPTLTAVVTVANPLNTACYMLWDMDGGIDSFQFSGVSAHTYASIQLLERLANSNHPATIESAIHGLGHMIDKFRDDCQPILEQISAREDVSAELRDYANKAIHGYIQ